MERVDSRAEPGKYKTNLVYLTAPDDTEVFKQFLEFFKRTQNQNERAPVAKFGVNPIIVTNRG